MCDDARLTKDLFASLEDIKAGRRVFVVASKPPATDGIQIEAVITGHPSSSPQAALKAYCKASKLDSTTRLAIPILLPVGLNAEDAKGFKTAFNGKLLNIVFTP